MDWDKLSTAVQDVTGRNISFSDTVQSIGGGCINQAWKLIDQNGNNWFVKVNKSSLVSMFEAELKGLQEIHNSHSIRVPKPLCAGTCDNNAYLVMEYISFASSPSGQLLGEKLALMHQFSKGKFGWDQDNTIGSTRQINTWHKDWLSFWQHERLEFQLSLALKKGFSHTAYDSGMQLADNLESFFTDYQPIASLLHGDLWGGNYAADEAGNPVIYDPAIYYGDHEADLAMIELFGSPGANFFDAYNECFPIDAGYAARKILYNLYHILNHYNLFGGSYANQSENMIGRLLAEI